MEKIIRTVIHHYKQQPSRCTINTVPQRFQILRIIKIKKKKKKRKSYSKSPHINLMAWKENFSIHLLVVFRKTFIFINMYGAYGITFKTRRRRKWERERKNISHRKKRPIEHHLRLK